MWGWKRNGWGRRATACWRRSRGWMNGRFAGGGRSWRRTWRTDPSIECGRLVAATPRSKKGPRIVPALEELVSPETAGDPMSEQKWVRSSLRHLSRRLAAVGYAASPPTVGRLLRKLRYSMKANRKERERQRAHGAGCAVPADRGAKGGASGSPPADHQRRYQEEGADRGLQERRARLEPGGRSRQGA